MIFRKLHISILTFPSMPPGRFGVVDLPEAFSGKERGHPLAA